MLGGGGWGLHAPRRQRFSSHVAALKPSHHTPSVNKVPYMSCAERFNQAASRGRLWYSMSGGQLRQESESPITQLRGGGGGDWASRYMRGHLIHPKAKPSFPLFHASAHLHSQGQRGQQNFALHMYFLAPRLKVKYTILINKH